MMQLDWHTTRGLAFSSIPEICPECYALVPDNELARSEHELWHDKLDELTLGSETAR